MTDDARNDLIKVLCMYTDFARELVVELCLPCPCGSGISSYDCQCTKEESNE